MQLTATTRKPKDKAGDLRASHRVPAVVYGREVDSTPVSVDATEFLKVYREAGESTVISLKIDKEQHNVLVHDMQVHPVSGDFLHVDFYAIKKGQTVEVDIPISFVGVAPAVKDQGANLVKVLHEITVEAEPQNLPQEIEIDISSLEDLSSTIAIKDVLFPAGVEPVASPEDIVVAVTEATEVEEFEPDEEAEPIDFSEIEVEKKGKAEEEEGESVAPEGVDEGVEE